MVGRFIFNIKKCFDFPIFAILVNIKPFLKCSKNIKLLQCEQIIHNFETHDLEILNIQIVSQNNLISRKYGGTAAKLCQKASFIFGISRSRALK